MHTNLKGKKLLVLGSTGYISTIVKKAQELGVYTIVIDNRPIEKAPAKRIADVYYNIDFSDIGAVKELIETEQIDGVFTGFTDSYLPYYFQICEETGLSCYGGEHQFEIATNKAAFKKACVDAGVPTIPGGTVKTIEGARNLAESIGFPLMLKPVDNSGSRGVIKCESMGQLSDAFAYAISFSKARDVIVEKYLSCDSIDISYFAAGGRICLSTTDDREVHISSKSGSSVTSYLEYPSKYTKRYEREINNKVISMLKKEGFREGMIALQAFVDENSFYFCEMIYRTSGGQHYIKVKDQHGIDLLGLCIEYALTGTCEKDWSYEKESPWFHQKYGMAYILGIPGETIAETDGFDTIAKDSRVIRVHQTKSIGDLIGDDGTTAQIIGNIYMKCDHNDNAKEIAKELFSKISVKNAAGENIAWICIK